MTKADPAKFHRNIFSTHNKYQKKIILLAFLPSTLIFLSFILIVLVGNPIVTKLVLHTSFPDMEKLLNQSSGWIALLMSLIFAFSMVTAFVVSLNMVGALGRINRELDEIIAGRSQKTITCRPHDDLARELLERINILIKYYVEHKHENKNP